MTTKNGDMPAMPQDYDSWCYALRNSASLWTGMTKREMMAMHVLPGLISSGYDATFEAAARSAVRYTDALLAELERTK